MTRLVLLFIIFFNVALSEDNITTGIIKPIYEAKISVSVDGVVSKINFKEGDFVRKNNVIMKFDDKLQELETKRRKIILDDVTKLNSSKENLEILEKALEIKEEVYKKTKSISLNELNGLRMQYIGSKSEYESLKTAKQKEEVEYLIALNLLDYYKVKSPVDGIITKINPKLGEWVQAGDEIVHIVNTEICYVEIDLEIQQLKKLKLDSSVVVEVSENEKVIQKEGKVVFISAVADSSSGLIRAKINFDNKTNKVTPGLHAKIIF